LNKCLFSQFLENEYAESTAFHYVDKKIKVTYNDLLERVRQLQGNLKRIGVSKNDYVLVASEKEEDLFVAFMVLGSLGAKMVPINPGVTDHELNKIGEIIFIKYVLTHSQFLESHQEVFLKLNSLKGILTFDEFDSELPAPLVSILSKMEQTKKKEKIRIPEPSQVVTCHFTMKGFDSVLGVEHSYYDYLISLESCHRIYQFTPHRRLLSILPVYPIFGLTTNLLYPLMYGCELILQDKKMNGLLKAIEKYQIEHLNVVPVILEKMLLEGSKDSKAHDLSKLVIVAGGSYVTPELHLKFQSAFNLAPTQGYGLTETLPILSNDPKSSKKGSLGLLMRPDVQMKIMDAKGYEVPLGKAGELCFKGPGVITKYISKEDVNKHLFRSGWLRTGDICYQEEDGHVIFLGRRLNFTKIAGNMVDLKEIEELVIKIPGVKSSRAHVVTENGREKLGLALFVSHDFSTSRKDILDHLRSHLSNYKIPSLLKIFKSTYHEVTL
jgi:long-chain acyl-CoA synthetase